MELNYDGYEKYLVVKDSIANVRNRYCFAFDNGYGVVVITLHDIYGKNRCEFVVCASDERGRYSPTRIIDTEFADGTLMIDGENIKKWLGKVKNLK